MPTWLITILIALLRVLIPVLAEKLTRTVEDAQPQPELRTRLQRRIRATWPAAAALLLMLSGCARTVLVPDGEPVRLRATVRGAKVWVMGANGVPVAGVMDLPEGWYALPEGD